MGKLQYIYRNYDSASMKTRSSIPTATDITTAASYIDCVNIKASVVYSTVGAAGYAFSQLMTATGINHWSAFGPTVRTAPTSYSGQITNTGDPTANYALGSFAGYNHNAVAPSWNSGNTTREFWVVSGDVLIIDCILDIGEILYSDILTNPGVGVAVAAWNGATCMAWKDKVITGTTTGMTNLVDFSTTSTTGKYGDRMTVTATTSMTLTVKAYVLKNTPYDYANESGTVCGRMTAQWPDWSYKIHRIVANTFYLDGPQYVYATTSGWSWQNPSFGTTSNYGIFAADWIMLSDMWGTPVTGNYGLKGYVEAADYDLTSYGPTLTYEHVIAATANVTGWTAPSHDLWQTTESGGDLAHTGYITAGGNVYQPLSSGYGYRIHISPF
jgi:hypothetical protein